MTASVGWPTVKITNFKERCMSRQKWEHVTALMALVTWTSISSSSYTCQSCRMRCQQNALPSKSSSSSIEAMRSFKWRRRWQMGSWGVPHAELQSFWSCVTAALSIVSGQWEAFSRQTKIQRYMLMGEPTTANSTLLRSAIMRKCGTH